MTSLQILVVLLISTFDYSISDEEFPAPTKLLTSPKDVVVLEGESIALECIFDTSAISCYWEKDNEIIEIEGRYEYIGQNDAGNCTIRIKNANYRDDGLWRCGYPQTSTSSSIKSNTANVTIGATPLHPVIAFDGIPIETGDRVYLLTAQDVPKLTCWSENGNPPGKLIWKINDVVQAGQMTTLPSTKSPRLQIVKLSAGFRVTGSHQQQKLYCEATHPSYKTPRQTYIRLILRSESFR